MPNMTRLLKDIKACTICTQHLPFPPKPLLQVSASARLLIAGQAPGLRAHQSGVLFDDPSGVRLREWLGLSQEEFYDRRLVAVLPMGFCYPGKGRSGDNPPRPECAPAWRRTLLESMPQIELTIIIGRHAQQFHAPEDSANLTDAVREWKKWWPNLVVLPHPSPRNNIWLQQNPWFARDVIPEIRKRVRKFLDDSRRPYVLDRL